MAISAPWLLWAAVSLLLILRTVGIGLPAVPAPALGSAGAAVVANGPAADTAVGTPVDTLLEKVEQARKNVKTLKAQVTYHRKVEALDIEEEFSGSFIFEMPRFLRMDLQEKGEDARHRLYIVGKKYAWIVYPDKKQAERFLMGETESLAPPPKAGSEAGPNPFEYGLTHGIKELCKAFNMRITGEEKLGDTTTAVLELSPKPTEGDEGRPPEEKLLFWVDKEKSLPLRVREYKSRGQIVETFTLSALEVNVGVRPPFREDPFDYRPPRDFEVISYGDEQKAAGEK